MEYLGLYGTFLRSLFYHVPAIIALIFGIIVAAIIIKRSNDKIALFLLFGCGLLLINSIALITNTFVSWQYAEYGEYSYGLIFPLSVVHNITGVIGLLCLAYSFLGMFAPKRQGVNNVS